MSFQSNRYRQPHRSAQQPQVIALALQAKRPKFGLASFVIALLSLASALVMSVNLGLLA